MAGPLVTHIPDALAHEVEVRAGSMATQIVRKGAGLAMGVAYQREGESSTRLQRARVVAVAGCPIETPRLLLNTTTGRFPNGLCNNEDQVGRYVMVQGATQTAGRFPDEMRRHKAPPPEISSEDFHESDAAHGFARGFSIQTVSPLRSAGMGGAPTPGGQLSLSNSSSLLPRSIRVRIQPTTMSHTQPPSEKPRPNENCPNWT